jgi:hypothetical protein
LDLRHGVAIDADEPGEHDRSKKWSEEAIDASALDIENQSADQNHESRHCGHLVNVRNDGIESRKPIVVAEELLEIHALLFFGIHVVGAVLVLAGLLHRFQGLDVGLSLVVSVVALFQEEGNASSDQQNENEDEAVMDIFVHGFM